MPNGYFGMFVLSYYPFLWFWVMDRELAKAVGGNPERVNFDPRKRKDLMRKYFSQHASAAV
jgi:alkane 1-monooxygenase